MKPENNYSNFEINEKDFRMWVFDRHNPEDSEIFEPVKIPDKNKLLEQIPAEYAEIRAFIASSNTDKLQEELTEKRRQHRKELEQEYIKEKLTAQSNQDNQHKEDSFDMKSENLRKALLQAYENTDAKISFSSSDYSQIKKEKSNRQKQEVNKTDTQTDEEKIDSQLKKYKTANICLISLIFALLIFFVGQRYIERNDKDLLSLFNPLTDSTSILQESTTADISADLIASDTQEATTNSSETTSVQKDESKENTTEKATSAATNSIININTASAKELQSLEGIGEVKAAKIIEYRENYGKFSSTRDILKVSGIGEKTYEKIKDKITVE